MTHAETVHDVVSILETEAHLSHEAAVRVACELDDNELLNEGSEDDHDK